MSDRTVGLRDRRQLANLLNCIFAPRDDEISTVNPPPVEASLNTHSSGLCSFFCQLFMESGLKMAELVHFLTRLFFSLMIVKKM